MRIAINAISVKEGGGIVALEKLLAEFVRLKPEHEYYVIANHSVPFLPGTERDNVHRCQFGWAERNYLLGSLWYLLVLPPWLKSKHIDVLFSQTCYLPPWGPKRTALLVQDPTHFWDAPTARAGLPISDRVRAGLKKLWAHYSVHVADEVTVQTKALGGCVAKHIPSAGDRIKVIPHGPGYLDAPRSRPPRMLRAGDTFELTYVALYRDYKNFTILFRALKLLNGRGVPARLNLTLDRAKPEVQALEKQISEMGLSDQVVNLGQLDKGEVTRLYEKSHLFIFPSVCESFGFPQVEAMAFGLPILAADTPVNREVCGGAAAFFPANDAQALATLIDSLYRNPEALALASRLSAQRAGNFDWTRAAGETLGWMTNGRNHH